MGDWGCMWVTFMKPIAGEWGLAAASTESSASTLSSFLRNPTAFLR